MTTTETFAKAAGKIKDLINYGQPEPGPPSLLEKSKKGLLPCKCKEGEKSCKCKRGGGKCKCHDKK
jgi:hypothetical protein